MKTKALSNIGVEILDCRLDRFGADEFAYIARLYRSNPVVVIRQPDVNLLQFAKVCASIGHIANEPFDPFKFEGTESEIPHQRVTGILKDGKPTGIFGQGRLDWHCNMNGPNRAAGVGLLAVSGVEGSITSWMSTIPAYEDLSDEMKARLENLEGHFHYNPVAWAPGMAEFQREGMMAVAAKDGPYRMKLVQKSLDGRKGIYFHYHNNCTIPDDPEMYDFLMKHLFQEKYIYHHHWLPGDIVLSDQLISLHKRQTDEVSRRLLYRYTYHHPKPAQKNDDATAVA